jgi:drug/metabolite transporter (DMT)-like permease
MQIIFFRNALAFIPILFLINKYGGLSLLKTNNHIGHFWRGLVGIIAMLCFFLSFVMLPLANATSIHFAAPLILTILSIYLLDEKVGYIRWGAVIIGLIGVLFMVNPFEQSGNLTGNLVAFLAAILAAFAMIFVRKLGRTEHSLTIVFYFTLYGCLFGALGMLFLWNPIHLESFMFLILCGLIGGVGQVLLTLSYANAPAAYVAPFSYLAMVFAVIFDVLIWHIWPSWQILTGSSIIILSGLFIVYRESRKHKIENDKIYKIKSSLVTDKDKVSSV